MKATSFTIAAFMADRQHEYELSRFQLNLRYFYQSTLSRHYSAIRKAN